MSLVVNDFKSFRILKNAPHNVLEQLAKFAKVERFLKGSTIVSENQADRSLYLIQKGSVSITLRGVLIAQLHKNDFFGEMALLTQDNRKASVMAESDVVAYKIIGNDFYTVLKQEPNVLHSIMIELVERISHQNEHAVERYHTLQKNFEELNESHKQLMYASKLAGVGEMVAVVAHEINNPLAVILGNTEILKDRLAGTQHIDVLRMIETATQRILAIVKGLRTSARTEDTLTAIDVHTTIQDLLLWTENLFKKRGIRIVTQLNAAPSVILGNSGKIQQALLNLMSNARDAFDEFKQENPTIEIRTSITADFKLAITVSDNGSGIKKENMARIFESHFTTKAAGKGTGLGLSIVSLVVRSMRGEIKVESEEGKGTSFHILIPFEEGAKS